MDKKSSSQIVGQLVDELADFSPDERRRIMHAALTLLGDAVAPAISLGVLNESNGGLSFPAKARMWMKQYGVTAEQISEVFHLSETGMEVIASVPGASRREQVRNAYVLFGIGELLSRGETKFDDKSAREFCEAGGFFDHTNHMKYMKGSEFTGSKEKGWVLTTPGLKYGAHLIISLAK
jgi:hypothetical protein